MIYEPKTNSVSITELLNFTSDTETDVISKTGI